MFNEIIVKNFSAPEYAAEISDATDVIELGNAVCGDRIKIQLRIDNGLIEQAGYAAWGCATSLATGNIFCASIQNMSIAAAAKTGTEDINRMLGELDPSQHHCLEMLHSLFDQLKEIANAVGRPMTS